MSLDSWLEPPEGIECCEADECIEPDEEGNTECHCEDHVCSTCGLQCACRCDDDYEAWRDSMLDWPDD